MNHSAAAVLGLVGWMVVLLALMALSRVALVLTGKKAPNAFRPDSADLSPFMQRLTRAHANWYESVPMLLALLLLAIATHTTAITDALALWLVAARVGQSTVHLISTSVLAVNIRFVLFLAQVLIGAFWVLRLFQQLA